MRRDYAIRTVSLMCTRGPEYLVSLPYIHFTGWGYEVNQLCLFASIESAHSYMAEHEPGVCYEVVPIYRTA
jgi:hypothetical protein